MRRLSRRVFLLASALMLISGGCGKRRQREPVKVTDDGAIASMIQVADPRAAVQLVKGFHVVEGDAWRWTARSFTVTLRPPRTAAQKGARLVLKFAIPDVSINRLKAISLSATVNGLPLPPEQYTQSGEFTYTRDVPANALAPDAVTVDFTLDKSLPPTATDRRELGVIVSAVGFEAK